MPKTLVPFMYIVGGPQGEGGYGGDLKLPFQQGLTRPPAEHSLLLELVWSRILRFLSLGEGWPKVCRCGRTAVALEPNCLRLFVCLPMFWFVFVSPHVNY